MSTVNLKQNIGRIYTKLRETENLSQINKTMGYTSTSQLHSVLNGRSVISTKAIIALIENYKINPTFLFLGTGEIFQVDESEMEKLQKENQELLRKHNELVKALFELNEIIKKLEQRNADLIDLSSAAIKYHKQHKEDEPKTEEEI
jgi:hypothetical protein